ncbi:MAG: DUF3656 domain-containing protein [Spirochaetales bacterium]|nr:DUF3656 domain-containing protein [Spirochaetales bacterium]
MELLAPAGSIDQALQAISCGADAVYFGLRDFSARKAAANFSFDEARILKKKCLEHKTKMYCTLNTIILDSEIERIRIYLGFLDYLECDALIVQDFAVARLKAEMGLDIPLHASTQMAVHSPDGAAFMAQCGFTRVILARELTCGEISRIHDANPSLELEVFIHGALCYSMSGNCFASSFITGRSGNRGECSQVCRTWFSNDGGKGYFFSADDLARREEILALAGAGVTALKIEGRMKSPAYAAAAVSYYRKILDGEKPGIVAEKRLKTAFARKWWPGFSEQNKTGSISPDYPGHRGLFAGRVLDWKNGLARLELAETLHSHDGVLFFGQENGLVNPLRMAWPPVYRNGTRRHCLQAGESVEIALHVPVYGEFYKISSHDEHITTKKRFSSTEFWKKSVSFNIAVHDDCLQITAEGYFSAKYKTIMEKSSGKGTFEEKIAALMEKSGISLFSCGHCRVEYHTESGKNLFIPPSVLKNIKNDIYKRLDISISGGNIPSADKQNSRARKNNQPATILLPEREKMSPERRLPLPFISRFNGETVNIPAETERCIFLPLRPINFNEKAYKTALFAFVSAVLADGKKVVIGLNNPAHLHWACEIAGESVFFFIDYALCCANNKSLDFFRAKIPGLIGILPWIEAREQLFFNDITVIRAGDGFAVPYFTSRHCYFSSRYGCSGCSAHDRSEGISQNTGKYLIIAEECLNYLLPQ